MELDPSFGFWRYAVKQGLSPAYPVGASEDQAAVMACSCFPTVDLPHGGRGVVVSNFHRDDEECDSMFIEMER